MTPRITGDETADLVIFLLGIFGWAFFFRIIYSPREGFIWWIEAITRVVVGAIIGGVAGFLLGFDQTQTTVTAWLIAGLAVSTAKPRL